MDKKLSPYYNRPGEINNQMENKNIEKKKFYWGDIFAFAIGGILILGVLGVLISPYISKYDEAELKGAWYIEGDNSPYFKLKEDGKAMYAAGGVTDSEGNFKAGLCDVRCKWKIRNEHLILETFVDVDLGEIISIENGIMTCDDNGEIKRYVRQDLSIYDIW